MKTLRARFIGIGIAAAASLFAVALFLISGLPQENQESQSLGPRICKVQNLSPAYSMSHPVPHEQDQLEAQMENFSIDISQEIFECADRVVLVPTSAPLETQILTSRLATSLKSPLLFYDLSVKNQTPSFSENSELRLNEGLTAELIRLSPKEIYFTGSESAAKELDSIFPHAILVQRFSETEPEEILDAIIESISPQESGVTNVETLVVNSRVNEKFKLLELMRSISLNASLQFFNTSAAQPNQADAENNLSMPSAEFLESESVRLAGISSSAPRTANGEQAADLPVWLLPSEDLILSLSALPALAALEGDLLIANSKTDLRTSIKVSEHLRRIDTNKRSVNTRFIGERNENTSWQLGVLENASPLPSGKLLLFQDERLVAFYGKPGNQFLGILGSYENSEEVLEGLLPFAALYETDDIIATPTFEIIATLADREAGVDGNFSQEASVEELRPWVEEARKQGVYVILDLQPGRTDFLSQAKLYEELLLYENVGLALDPEWRLQPHEFHLQQIGRVSADEVNQVVDWLASLIRRENLPQKLLIVHQFRVFMIQNREQIKSPPELAILINADGHGTFDRKLEAYSVLSARLPNEPERFFGWKNFFNRDETLIEPDAILGLDPLPGYINYH